MSSARRLQLSIVGVALLLGAWEALVRIRNVRPFVLRAPSQILRYMGSQWTDYLQQAGTTAWHAVVGMAIALALALMLGAAMAASPVIEQLSLPGLMLIQVTPFVLYISSVVLWLREGSPPVLFITALVCVPPFTFAAVAGMRGADPAARELFASVDASRLEVLWRLRLPSAMPGLFAASRYAIGLALISAYLVEGGNFANQGLGAVGKRAAALQEGDALWGTAFSMAILGTLGLVGIGVLERVLLSWHASQRTLVKRRESDTVPAR